MRLPSFSMNHALRSPPSGNSPGAGTCDSPGAPSFAIMRSAWYIRRAAAGSGMITRREYKERAGSLCGSYR
jgi:hypothetical protein